MVNVSQMGSDFGSVISDWPEELLYRGAESVRCLVDETTFSRKLADGGLVSDFGGAVFIKKDEMLFQLDAKDLVSLRDHNYKVLSIQESSDRVHLRVALQILGR